MSSLRGHVQFREPVRLRTRSNLISVVGAPVKISFASNDSCFYNDEVDDIPTGYSTILTPQFHPDMNKRTSQLPNGARGLMDLVFQIVLCVGATVMEVATTPRNTREQVVEMTMELLKRVDVVSGQQIKGKEDLKIIETNLNHTSAIAL
jgi:hypothetical protein